MTLIPMRRGVVLTTVILFIFAGTYVCKAVWTASPVPIKRKETNRSIPYKRIISLAPSITETLFALGLGDYVVGVTQYCKYPPAALDKEQIGGYYNPNYEAVITLKPDLVVLLPEHDEPLQRLKGLGIKTLVLNHRGVGAILESITAIARECGVEKRGEEIGQEIRKRIERVRTKTGGLHKTRVMVSVGRNMGTGSLKDIYISGQDGFYSDMISLAGGVNIYAGKTVPFPTLSAEAVMRLDPEVIIDVVTGSKDQDRDRAKILADWQSLPGVSAVKNNRVHMFSKDYAVIPGPRFINTLEEMAEMIHPEAGLKSRGQRAEDR